MDRRDVLSGTLALVGVALVPGLTQAKPSQPKSQSAAETMRQFENAWNEGRIRGFIDWYTSTYVNQVPILTANHEPICITKTQAHRDMLEFLMFSTDGRLKVAKSYIMPGALRRDYLALQVQNNVRIDTDKSTEYWSEMLSRFLDVIPATERSEDTYVQLQTTLSGIKALLG